MDIEKKAISIWFFIGVVLVVFGALILGAGIYGLIVPPAHPVVLNELHVGIWWGGVLLILGVVYVVKFNPRKGRE